ncbi:MAG: peptidase T [Clostridia bacterium]|nr:peptidase T [Clostridia bacterium]
MRAYERLIKYTEFATGSDENNEKCPSTEAQRGFAEYLADELRLLGVTDVRVDENGYVYAKIPANCAVEKGVNIGFIAHMDTISDVEYRNVRPRVIEGYDGGEIVLNEKQRIVMPALPECKDKSLVVTDGTTILGADDKAGIAEIMTAVEALMSDNTIEHGEVCIGFTPDEEIGRGADLFKVNEFGAHFAYTVDGANFGQIEYENFNAINAKVKIKGKSVHPGEAKYGGMKNANGIAMEFESMLPKNEKPEYTEGYEGFYHLMEIKSDVENAEMRYILRDHDGTKIKIKRAMFESIADFLNKKYGKDTVELELVDVYENMAEKIEPHYHLIDDAVKAIESVGGVVDISPIRGGTDGARLSQMGLPCPNLGTGSANHHGRFEYAVIEEMDKCVETIIRIIESYR